MKPYISDIFCEVCDKAIDGEVKWHADNGDDLLVCEQCHRVFDCERQRQIRQMPDVSLPWLLIVFGGSLLTMGVVDSWPLVDALAMLAAFVSGSAATLKLYGKVRR